MNRRLVPVLLLLTLCALLVAACCEDDDRGDALTNLVGGFPQPDDTPPAVAAQSPADGATGVALDEMVSVTFTKAMAEISRTNEVFVNDTTFFALSPDTLDAEVVGRPGEDRRVFEYELLPSPRLHAARTYEVVVTTDVRDEFGIEMDEEYRGSFATVPSLNHEFDTGRLWFRYIVNDALLPQPEFSVSGGPLAPDGTFPAGVDSACAAVYRERDEALVFGYGVVRRPDDLVDGLFIVAESPGFLEPGEEYAITPENVTRVVFAEGIEDFALPPDLDPRGLVAWADTLTTEATYVSPQFDRFGLQQVVAIDAFVDPVLDPAASVALTTNLRMEWEPFPGFFFSYTILGSNIVFGTSP